MVVSGGRDLTLLALGLVGMVAVGPMELFFPRAAASVLGPKVWLLLMMLYGLVVMLTVLASRPRLIVYGLGVEELQDHLQVLMQEMDRETRWLGESVQAPQLGISAIVEAAGPGKVSHLLAVSHRQHLPGWVSLERQLMKRLRGTQVARGRGGWWYLVMGIGVLGVGLLLILQDPSDTMQSMRDMLRI